MASEDLHLEPLEHRGKYCIAIRGRLGVPAESAVRAFPNRLYSRSQACWYLVYSRETLASLCKKLSAFQAVTVGQFDELKEGSENEVKVLGIPLPPGYHERLIEVRYSPATVRTYESQMREFLSYLRPKTLNDLTEDIVRSYMRYLAEKKRVSTSTQNTAINAIKFYLEKVLGGERKVYYIDRPLKEKRLPRVLSEREVTAMIEVTQNPKHRLMIMLLFSSGLRLSELLNLKWSDFDVDSLKIFVNGGKGRKDRYTVLSEKIIPFVIHYLNLYHPVEYLFEGLGGGKYSVRSVGRVIQRAAFLAGINKRVSPHTLRHSFATNMLEHGVDLRYIQILLGHESSITTERYTHMTAKGFSAIKSPLDWLRIDSKPLNLLND